MSKGTLARAAALPGAAVLFAAWLWPAAPPPPAPPPQAAAASPAAAVVAQEAAAQQAQRTAAAAPVATASAVPQAQPLEHVSGDDPKLRYTFREDEGLQRRVVYAPEQATASNPFGAQDWGARGPAK